MNEKELKNKILTYFEQEIFIGHEEADYFVLKQFEHETLEENIQTLLTRDKNHIDRIKELRKFEKIYQEDKYRAYKDALEESKKIVKEDMTLKQAFEILSKMTLEEIIDNFS